MGVGEWLRSLGLGQYEAVFRENSIGSEVLADLNESDLGQLGVVEVEVDVALSVGMIVGARSGSMMTVRVLVAVLPAESVAT